MTEFEAARQSISNRKQGAVSVHRRWLQDFRRNTDVCLLPIDDKSGFLSLIWHQIDESRFLTPSNEPRTLQHVGDRFLNGRHTFQKLSDTHQTEPRERDPKWFRRCAEIVSAEFCYCKFGCPILGLPTADEEEQSPAGTFYILDGAHRTLVLATKLLEGEIEFSPVQALLLLPRP
jgi:hypothetical protein